jgi:hypothetical protein
MNDRWDTFDWTIFATGWLFCLFVLAGIAAWRMLS